MLVGLNFSPGESVELGGRLMSKAPAGWKKQEPASKLRTYQFAVPKVEGDKEDAELVVFFFGAGGGGSTDDNLKRWKAQFIAPEGKTIDEVSKLEKYKVGKGADVVCLDIAGTYKYKVPPNSPTAKEERKENFRRFNVIFDTDKGRVLHHADRPREDDGQEQGSLRRLDQGVQMMRPGFECSAHHGPNDGCSRRASAAATSFI